MRFFEIILFLFYFFNCYNLLEILAASRYKEKSSECGIQKIRNKKIYGGTEAARGEYPWIGQIIYSRRNQSVCAATVIHRKFLLTAAHCISGTALRVYGHPKSVRLGIHDSKDAIKNEINCSRTPMLSSNPGDLCASAYLQEITIDDLIIHEIYSETISDKHHDIGLIILSRHINYDEFTRPICLPASNFDLEPGTNLYIAGWGKTFYESASSKKMKANIPLMTNTKCMEIYNYVQLNLSDGQICAGGEGGRDTCRGDSGGPLMYQNPNRDQFIIYGITSFGSYRCGQPNFPAIYTRVGYYLDWINNFIYD